VEVAKRAGARVIFSLHNYHTICPQVYLMQGHRRACHDSDAGHNCTNCIETKAPAGERRKRAEDFLKKRAEAKDDPLVDLRRELKGEWGGFKHEFTWPIRVVKRSSRLVQLRREIKAAEADEPSIIPGEAVDTAESATRPFPFPTPRRVEKRTVLPEEQVIKRPVSHDHRGQTQGLLDDQYWKPRTIDPSDPAHWPLENVARPDPPATRAPNEYGKRRAAMVRMLSTCDRVLAVSEFVRDKFVAMGVDPKAIEAMHIGSRVGQLVERNRELVFDPPSFDAATPFDRQRPVRLVFMGYNNLYKGLHVFADALEMLTPEYLRQIDLAVWALDGKSIEWRFRRLEPRLAKLVFNYGYYYQDIPWMLGGKDLGVVPSVWWDNAPQTVFEFNSCRVPVLGARAGGIPDFVKDNVNGLLFQANNAWDLARRLVGAIREPWKLTEMRKHVRPPKDIDLHAVELERVYGVPRR
jgi:glycosyltransferase involved in cell wall biosynthesis